MTLYVTARAHLFHMRIGNELQATLRQNLQDQIDLRREMHVIIDTFISKNVNKTSSEGCRGVELDLTSEITGKCCISTEYSAIQQTTSPVKCLNMY